MKNILLRLLVLGLLTACKQSAPKTSDIALAEPSVEELQSSIVFITGIDQGENTYYGNAKNHYENLGMTVVSNLFSLHEVLTWLNKNASHETAYDEIHIVTHGNPWLGMSLQTTVNGGRINIETIRLAKENKEFPAVRNGIKKETKIIFHSCGLGQNLPLLQALKSIFESDETPNIYASAFFNVYGGKYAPHYLAKPYYGFYPTAQSKGPVALAKQFSGRYGKTDIDWRVAIESRKERNIGEVYSYTFNIPVNWAITFDTTEEIPSLDHREAIMDFVSESADMANMLYRLNIPIEKYRWKTEIEGNTLLINGKTTVLCVLEPILDIDDNNEYRKTSLTDTFLYQIL